jgi:hypothetical protein
MKIKVFIALGILVVFKDFSSFLVDAKSVQSDVIEFEQDCDTVDLAEEECLVDEG